MGFLPLLYLRQPGPAPSDTDSESESLTTYTPPPSEPDETPPHFTISSSDHEPTSSSTSQNGNIDLLNPKNQKSPRNRIRRAKPSHVEFNPMCTKAPPSTVTIPHTNLALHVHPLKTPYEPELVIRTHEAIRETTVTITSRPGQTLYFSLTSPPSPPAGKGGLHISSSSNLHSASPPVSKRCNNPVFNFFSGALICTFLSCSFLSYPRRT